MNADWLSWLLLALLTLESAAIVVTHSRRTCTCPPCRARRDEHHARTDRQIPRQHPLDRWH